MTTATWTFSPHAKARRKEMRLTEDRVLEAIVDPDMQYPGSREHGRSTGPRTVYVKGNIAVVTTDAGVIVTCLWHRKESR